MHALNRLEALVVEVKFFVELDGAVIHFPFVLKEFLNPLFVQSGDATLLVALTVTVRVGVYTGHVERISVGVSFRLVES